MMKTYADLKAERASNDAPVAAAENDPIEVKQGTIDAVYCASCRLSVAHDMLVDVSSVDQAISGGFNWVCTGCLEMWWLKGRCETRGEILQMLGAELDEELCNHPHFCTPAQRTKDRNDSNAQGK